MATILFVKWLPARLLRSTRPGLATRRRSRRGKRENSACRLNRIYHLLNRMASNAEDEAIEGSIVPGCRTRECRQLTNKKHVPKETAPRWGTLGPPTLEVLLSTQWAMMRRPE